MDEEPEGINSEKRKDFDEGKINNYNFSNDVATTNCNEIDDFISNNNLSPLLKSDLKSEKTD